MTARCGTCGVEAEAVRHGDSMHLHRIVIGKVTHQWQQCRACELEEIKTQDERAEAAIEVAEQAGV